MSPTKRRWADGRQCQCVTSECLQACHALTMWIQSSPEYASLLPVSVSPEHFKFTSSFMSSELHQETASLYMRAARSRAAHHAVLDPDVQVV